MSLYNKSKKSSFLSDASSIFVESLYEEYLNDRNSVSSDWQSYFDTIKDNQNEIQRTPIKEKFKILAKLPKGITTSSTEDNCNTAKQASVLNLIAAYRNSGHKAADSDPLRFRDPKQVIDLDPSFHGLTDADMETAFNVGTLFTDEKKMKLKDIISFLKSAYTNKIGIEANHIHDIEEKRWIQERFEQYAKKQVFSNENKKEILDFLVRAEGLERYLHTKYIGQKRFSLEGGDSFIPIMDNLIQGLGEKGTKEVVIGMAHRGRLNLLINIMGKLPSDLFAEFEGSKATEKAPGDVKYHMGFSSDVETSGGDVHLALAFNPSHLEIVNPVVQGSVRSRLECESSSSKSDSVSEVFNKVVPIQVHGDASFAGQGVIQETLQLSQVRGYRVGGTIHVIINNQIGFTTSNLLDARSSQYCSDPAKIVQAPVIHVNGDDPEACVYAAKVASDYLIKFKKDIVIDLVCYRRLGHNEADEPAATQPLMYQKIRSHKTTLELYSERLIENGIVTDTELKALKEDYKDKLDKGVSVARPLPTGMDSPTAKAWNEVAISEEKWHLPVDTSISIEKLQDLAKKVFIPPESFTPHNLIKKTLNNRLKMASGEMDADWGFAENMAYASLLDEGYQVRVSGEDCGRGTFSHRHAVIHDVKTGESYTGLKHIKECQPACRVIDSILSEEAVLAYEYGFATKEPNALTIWEGQFGDFANGAQVVFDQFISSGEAKWGRFCGLTVLLPHGYEGQGPEHSSARLERYLQLCAKKNMRVCVPTTPSQIFHLLRRQMLQSFRKPLIVMTPKSLLRHKLAVNSIEHIANGSFQVIIDEIDNLKKENISKVIFCSGRVFYDLLEERRERNIENIAIVRIEELYPFPQKEYQSIISSYPNIKDVVWCQEEPENQGAWRQINFLLKKFKPENVNLHYAGRDESASTAAGFAKIHKKEQAKLVDDALTI